MIADIDAHPRQELRVLGGEAGEPASERAPGIARELRHRRELGPHETEQRPGAHRVLDAAMLVKRVL